jgi:hypothetical protein
LYLDHSSLEPGVYEALMKLVALEEGEEFALTEAELNRVVAEGCGCRHNRTLPQKARDRSNLTR